MNPLLSIADVATFTGLSEHSIRRAIKAGELPATMLRGRYRIDRDDLLTWVDAGRIKPPAAMPELAGLQQTPAPLPDPPAGSYRDLARRRRQRRAA
jgi:excisionase family DNA binding protein